MNDFAAGLHDLNEAGIRYVIVGGLAVIRHGAVRATKDVGGAVAMDTENLSRLDALLQRWEATNPDGSPLRTRVLSRGGVLALRTRHCLVDILSEQLLPVPFNEVLGRSDVKRIDGVELPVTDDLARTHLAIPMSPVLTAEQAAEVTAAVRAVLG